MINIVFLGAPGSGKGTQSSLLAKILQIPTISTGEILRKEVVDQSEIGNLAKNYMNSGGLVPDKVVIDIIKKRIAGTDCDGGFILDGFPRNYEQAQILEKMLKGVDKRIDLVINIEVSDEVLIKRISGRFSCKKCKAVYNAFFSNTKVLNICDQCGGCEFENRGDDNEETVRSRLKIYNQNTAELIDFYRKKSLIYSVDGLKDIALVNLEINRVIKSIIPNI
jgi:adenylate kinase